MRRAPRKAESAPAPHVAPDPAFAAPTGQDDPAHAEAAAMHHGAHEGPDVPGLAPAAPTAKRLAENIERIETLGQRLVSALGDRPKRNSIVDRPTPELLLTTANAWLKTLADEPSRIIEHQVNFWGETLKHYARAQASLAQGKLTLNDSETPTDKRFSNPLWRSHPYFNFIMTQYQINAKALQDAARDLQMPDETARRRVNWLTNQVIDMMAPTNFLATNPDALEKAVATEGESLVRGLENLVRDVEQHGGEMVVSLADHNAFSVGDNIGTTPGVVVHRSPLFELIQYNPATDQVHALPVLIFPPWINKFYILDLKPQNSLIRWLIDQGHTLFVVSWKNPDASYSTLGMDDYVAAYLEAMDKVLTLTGQRKLNAVGYCIAGTTLSLTLALLKRRGDERVNSATFFTTLTDFSDQGEFTNFLQDDFITGITDEIKRQGMLQAALMSRTMSFLRANDLVWGPAIRSYMMGESPPAFDLLYWNGDSTNLPGRMAMEYLEGLCQRNRFAEEGFEVMGQRLHLSDVDVSSYSVACEGDHIAPWKDCWRGFSMMGSRDKTFVLSESGHIAGIVNPPSKKKYGHYAGSTDFGHGFEAWRDSSSFSEGSWWPRWGQWLAERSGGMVPQREPGEGICPAPGTYVHERPL